MQLCFQTWRSTGITAMKHKACRQIPTRSISKNTSAAEYHISKRESYHVAKVNIFSNFHPVCLCLYRCVFYRKYNKNHETTKPLGRKQESSRPACAAFGIRKKRKEQKIAFSRGYPRVPLRNEHAACRLDLPGFCPLRGRFRRGVLLRPAH